jgi:acetyl-CoA carboxylase biotin carboxyl carrier protein
MSLTAADVAEIMRLVEQSGFDELTLEIDGMKLCLRRGATAEGAEAGAVTQGFATAGTTAAAADKSAGSRSPSSRPKEGNVAVPADPNVHDVTSPLLGTFYRAPKPGAPPFVEVGAQVDEETVVAIIEVMKLMNTVRAGVRGTVTAILLGDGALAEYGETLLRVRKSG